MTSHPCVSLAQEGHLTFPQTQQAEAQQQHKELTAHQDEAYHFVLKTLERRKHIKYIEIGSTKIKVFFKHVYSPRKLKFSDFLY